MPMRRAERIRDVKNLAVEGSRDCVIPIDCSIVLAGDIKEAVGSEGHILGPSRPPDPAVTKLSINAPVVPLYRLTVLVLELETYKLPSGPKAKCCAPSRPPLPGATNTLPDCPGAGNGAPGKPRWALGIAEHSNLAPVLTERLPAASNVNPGVPLTRQTREEFIDGTGRQIVTNHIVGSARYIEVAVRPKGQGPWSRGDRGCH